MKLDRASNIVILACLIGLSIMAVYVNTCNEKLIPLLLVPVAMMIYAKKVNEKEINDNES
jgi:hypothetical protein